MGKGDKKSKKGKVFMGSFGNSRRKKSATKAVASSKPGLQEKKVEKKAKKA
jgi:30S ribosomal protein S31